MEITYKIAQLDDVNIAYQFAEKQYIQIYPDDMERMIKIWESKFRQEALNHYFKLGWSFLAFKNDQLAGFFLGQPLLFVNGKTQCLWVEDIIAENSELKSDLIDVACKLSRDKHFQGVLISTEFENALKQKNIKYMSSDENKLWIKTTK